jgi:hypothetical protein
MKRIIVVATIVGLSAFAAFAQRGAGRGMGRAGAPPAAPAAPQNAQGRGAAAQGMPAGAQQHQPGVNLNSNLQQRLQPLVPAGMTLQDAAAGFRNNGQFIAALHVSQNLNIPFDQLKAKMTGPDAVPLGKAITELKPDMSKQQVDQAVKTAQQQAKADERAKDQTRERTQERDRTQAGKGQPASK